MIDLYDLQQLKSPGGRPRVICMACHTWSLGLICAAPILLTVLRYVDRGSRISRASFGVCEVGERFIVVCDGQ